MLLLADAALGGSDVLYVPTGESRVALGIRVRDLLVASRALVTTLTAHPLAVEERAGWPGPAGMEQGDPAMLPRPRRTPAPHSG